MFDLIKELVSKKRKTGFLANEISFTCPDCRFKENSTYFVLLKAQHFEILEPITILNTVIREFTIEEEINATPVKFILKCPKCGSQMEAFSPVSLEYLLKILQSEPTDDMMFL